MSPVELVKIDKQGRLVIPVELRRALGIEEGREVLVRIERGRIVIEPISRNLESSVDNWVRVAMGVNPRPFVDKAEEGWKWMSYEYAKRKLGISRRSG
ncbi:MAG: AbrB/MazE/SpoVT family DNA-binding domain-containing protein [Candidatus Nezhaarchaeota archaeon]|nr:AbrB/MazE/SpoVT family DNA-binding domain-containing protein [Candidatus Nezhaarchaeota archaeon]